MKKYLFTLLTALVTALGLASCAADDDLAADTSNTAVAKGDSTIRFKAQDLVTRSGETLDKFYVYISDAQGNHIVDGVEYTYDADEQVYKSETPHMWPESGNISVWAYSEQGYGTDPDNNRTSPSWPSRYFRISNTDLLCAVAKDVTKTTTAIPLTFKHATTGMTFSVKKAATDTYQYKVYSIKIEDTPGYSGLYNIENTIKGDGGVWSADVYNLADTEYEFIGSTPMEVTFSKGGTPITGKCFHVIPYADLSFPVRIEYTVSENGTVIKDYRGNKNKYINVDLDLATTSIGNVYNTLLWFNDHDAPIPSVTDTPVWASSNLGTSKPTANGTLHNNALSWDNLHDSWSWDETQLRRDMNTAGYDFRLPTVAEFDALFSESTACVTSSDRTYVTITRPSGTVVTLRTGEYWTSTTSGQFSSPYGYIELPMYYSVYPTTAEHGAHLPKTEDFKYGPAIRMVRGVVNQQ